MSLFRSSRRKLLLGAAAFGLLLAALAGFLLAPDGGRDNSVRIDLLRIETNAGSGSFGVFSVTNSGTRKVILLGFVTEDMINGQWVGFRSATEHTRTLEPGVSGAVFASIPEDERIWRAQWSWQSEPTRLQVWRMRLRQKTASFLPALKPNPRTA